MQEEVELARHGFGVCRAAKKTDGKVSVLYRRECERFSSIPDELAARRREWMESRNAETEEALPC
jgi:hypothetical protein